MVDAPELAKQLIEFVVTLDDIVDVFVFLLRGVQLDEECFDKVISKSEVIWHFSVPLHQVPEVWLAPLLLYCKNYLESNIFQAVSPSEHLVELLLL